METYKEYMIRIITQYWYYSNGKELEAMTEYEVKEVFESLIDWLGD